MVAISCSVAWLLSQATPAVVFAIGGSNSVSDLKALVSADRPELKRIAEERGYSIVEFSEGVVVEIGDPLGVDRRRARCAILRALADSNGTIRLGDLGTDAREEMRRQLSAYSANPDYRGIGDSDKTPVRFQWGAAIKIEGEGKSFATFNFISPPSGPSPDPVKLPDVAIRENRSKAVVDEVDNSLFETRFVSARMGSGVTSRSRLIVVYVTKKEQESAQALAEFENVAATLKDRLGAKEPQAGEAFSALTPEMQAGLNADMRANFRRLGFTDVEDARRWLLRTKVVSARTHFQLDCTIMGSNGIPTSVSFTLVP
ncbi:MAG TPA: hypothetical protein PLH94_11535 [Fimbriimonadaceae bacterium]|nr:hypothetical protein [Fimbriimonadaceae bacterium]